MLNMLFCKKCENQVSANVKICPNCGGRDFGNAVSNKTNPIPPSANDNISAVQTQGWLSDRPTPWRRYAARIIIDIPVNGLIGFSLIGIVAYSIAPMAADEFFNNLNILVDIVLTLVLGCFITGILTGLTGSTIGKLIFGLKVQTLSGQNPGLSKGISRDMQVALQGLWLGIPLISLVPLYLNYRKLVDTKTTPWDEGKYLVLYRASGPIQYILNVVGITVGVVVVAFLRSAY